jgi:hypothetical protein
MRIAIFIALLRSALISASHDHLVQRIFDDALSVGLLQLRNQRPGGLLLNHGVHRDPLAIGQRRDGRILQRGQKTENTGQIWLCAR